MTTKRAATGAIVLAATLASAACSPPEKRIIDQYFNAINAEDTQTLSSFAAVRFDKKVQSWKVVSVGEEAKEAAPLPDLYAKAQASEQAVAENKKKAQAYSLDHYNDIQAVLEARKKNAAVPARLQETAATWDTFNQKDRELKKEAAEAKDAFEQEKRYVTLSVGQVEGIETAAGEMQTKQVDLNLTVDGQVQDYVMTLRRYNLTGETAQRVISRWVVFRLAPKA
jgi:hypothetical protein